MFDKTLMRGFFAAAIVASAAVAQPVVPRVLEGPVDSNLRRR